MWSWLWGKVGGKVALLLSLLCLCIVIALVVAWQMPQPLGRRAEKMEEFLVAGLTYIMLGPLLGKFMVHQDLQSVS